MAGLGPATHDFAASTTVTVTPKPGQKETIRGKLEPETS